MENTRIAEMGDSAPRETTSKTVQDSPGLIVFPPVLYVGTLLLGLVPHWFWPMHLGRPLWVRITGGIMLAAGAAVAHWAQRTMHRAGTNVLPSRPALSIVTHGPFRFSRNPIYVANIFVYIGLSFLFNAVWPLLLLPPMVYVVYWGIIQREERYLETKFGEVYMSYKNRVPRWL